ncbi:RadC-like JAB domain-containing protein [Nitrosomonas sp. Nm84]|uniref:JAB domain-containing protein n=1 Tax=Nitrosomonas sp. Nm84 TaxID=200124 RepID=UPI000D768685|nr:JAB domain-containing protein [Nitrosomonas sp. Nm84]PXW89077.1 RadC-like JAB domain-containing protein [Nitrosomonas sp. Nm84]
MRDDLLKIPVNPSSHDEGDLYEKIETRPDTTEKQKEAGRSAYTELLEAHARWAGGTLLGCDFPKDFREKGGTTFLNQSIASGRDLAVMAQILRDPRYETLRIFYTRMNRIVHHTAVSSRLPGSVYLERIGRGNDDLDVWVEKTKCQVKADGYWILHNHPSGNATPSSHDIKFTQKLALLVSGFKGHIVINTSQYSVIDNMGKVDFVDWMGDRAGGYQSNHYKSHELLLEKIAAPQDLAKIGHDLKQRDQFFSLVGINAKGFVSSLSELPLSVLNRPQNLLLARLQNFARNSGVNMVFAVTNVNDFRHPILFKACEAGILRDVIATEGLSYRSLREERLLASIPEEVSAISRKPRAFVTEEGGLTKNTKNKGRSR